MKDNTDDGPPNNPLAAIYRFELYRLAYWIHSRAEELFSLTEPGPYWVKADMAIDPLIYSIICDAARIQRLIVAATRQKGESARRFRFREVRAQFLCDLLQGIELQEIHNAIGIAAEIGLWLDPNPNPVGPGILAFLTFWPGVICVLIGVVRIHVRGGK